MTCVETDEVFRSISAAARSIGVLTNTVKRVVGLDNRTSGGFHWRYSTDAELQQHIIDNNPPKPFEPKVPKIRGRAVVCEETGEFFPTLTAASEAHHVSNTSIADALSGEQHTAGGFAWREATETEKAAYINGEHISYSDEVRQTVIDQLPTKTDITPETIAESAKLYHNREAWKHGDQRQYRKAIALGIIDDVTGHMTKRASHTDADIFEIARQYQTRTALMTARKTIYNLASKRGILAEVCAHMVAPAQLKGLRATQG